MAKKRQRQNPLHFRKSPTRKILWKQLSHEVTAFSLVDPKTEGQEKIDLRKDELLQKLQSAGIGEGSHLHQILNEAHQVFQEYFAANPYEEPSTIKTKYDGTIEIDGRKRIVRVIVRNNSISVSRGYNYDGVYIKQPNEILYLDWNFNPAGRISVIKSWLYSVKDSDYDIVRVIHKKGSAVEWKSAESRLNEIPLEARIAIQKVEIDMPFRRHCGLIRAGHQLVNEILQKAETSETREEMDKRYKPLSNIIYDETTMEIIKLAASLTPTLNESKQKRFSISY